MVIKLRPFQEAAFESTMRYYGRGGTKPLISMATGLGKAYLGLALGLEVGGYREKGVPGRVAFLAHSKELTDQPYNSLADLEPQIVGKYYGKLPARGIVRAHRNQPDSRFLFATMQTLAIDEGRRTDEVLKHGAFDLVILDEAHHTAARSYADIIIPKMLEANPDTKLLGLTATPARSDGKALDSIFDDIVYQMNMLAGINGGWLKPITAKMVHTEVNIGAIPRYQGDFQEMALRNALRVQNWTEIIGRAYMEHDGKERFAIAFMPSVQMGRDLCDWFRDQGIAASSIDSEMVVDEEGVVHGKGNGAYEKARERAIEAYRGGDVRVLSGYSVLLEGFDAPNTDMILQGRPTESEVLLTQLIGRGLRQPAGIARVMKDSEREVYLVQRNDSDNWYEYGYQDLPFNSDCLILDFTLKDTSVLLAGSLAGNHYETPDIEEVEKETLDVFEVIPLPSDFDLILKKGEGAKYFKRNFFKMSTANYTFWDDATISAYLGAAGKDQNRDGRALFIYPRQKMMVSRMDSVLQILEQADRLDTGMTDEQICNTMDRVATFKRAFGAFLLFRLTEVPVRVTKKGEYESEWVSWDNSRIVIRWLGMFADHNAVWEAVLPISQQLSVGGFFVDKKRPGARNTTSTKQLDLMFNPAFKNGRPNLFYAMPARVNAVLDLVPGLDLFRIEKPSRKSMIDSTSVQVSGMLNHLGIYSAVMLHGLGAQLVGAQNLYNTWSKLWEQRRV